MADGNISERTNWHFSTDFKWLKNSYVKIEKSCGNDVCLIGNKQGLLSLSGQLMKVVRKSIPIVLYDEFPSDLEQGSWSMTLKLIAGTALCFYTHLNNACPKVNLIQTNDSINIKWHSNDVFVIIKEGNHGLQIAGNQYGLQSFSNHLYLVAHGLISHVSYEQSNGYSNNYITSFSVRMVNCPGR